MYERGSADSERLSASESAACEFESIEEPQIPHDGVRAPRLPAPVASLKPRLGIAWQTHAVNRERHRAPLVNLQHLRRLGFAEHRGFRPFLSLSSSPLTGPGSVDSESSLGSKGRVGSTRDSVKLTGLPLTANDSWDTFIAKA